MRLGVSAARLPRRPVRRYPNTVVRGAVTAVFFVVVLMTVVVTKLTFLIPLRSTVSLGLLAALAVSSPRRFALAVTRQSKLIFLALFFALVGAALAILNGNALQDIGGAVVEVHLQSIVTIILVATVSEWCGSRSVFLTFLVVIGITSVFAIGQFFDLAPFWQASKSLQALQNSDPLPPDEVNRPLGISFSQTVFAGQICLALSAFLFLRVNTRPDGRTVDLKAVHLLVGVAGLCLVAVLSGNRSPILGGAILLIIYLAAYRSTAFVLLVPLLLLAGMMVDPILAAGQEAGLRVAETGDTSSTGRLTLIRYGLLLFASNPLGYGILFNPTELWRPFYADLAQYPGVELVTFVPLHNYIVSMMNIYGFVFLLALPLLVYWILRYRLLALLFVPYMVHCFFHNSGPFFNEIYLWFVLSAVAAWRAELLAGRPRNARERGLE